MHKQVLRSKMSPAQMSIYITFCIFACLFSSTLQQQNGLSFKRPRTILSNNNQTNLVSSNQHNTFPYDNNTRPEMYMDDGKQSEMEKLEVDLENRRIIESSKTWKLFEIKSSFANNLGKKPTYKLKETTMPRIGRPQVTIPRESMIAESSEPEPTKALPFDGIGHIHPHQSNISPETCPACLDARLIQHYKHKGCTPVIYAGCKCPSRFRCPVDMPTNRIKSGRSNGFAGQNMDQRSSSSSSSPMIITESGEITFEGCRYNGSTYQMGQIVPTANICRICVCAFMDDGSVGVDCETQIQCPVTRSFTPRTQMWQADQSGKLVSSFMGRTMGQFPSFRLNCYDYYEHDKCCPRQECVPISARTGRMLKPRKTCSYNGRTYQLGERIDLLSITNNKLLEDENIMNDETESNLTNSDTENGSHIDDDDGIPIFALGHHSVPVHLRRNQFPVNFPEEIACLNCICSDGWNNSALEHGFNHYSGELFLNHMGNSCVRKSCEMHLNPQFKAGCLPVYHEDRCCPVDFICPRTRFMSMNIRGLDSGSKLCKFEGRKYAVGAKLYAMDYSAAPCVDCECRVPPDFTCLQRKNCIPPKQ
ncbi:hypothetical protein RDWZM_004274 [Blomia tropicalis]|uniref:Uncharacterized protein n=1 Tax=Blomia tropicalis TaxID=40697 RepID=A0A9Q0RTC8_BLOTA|nr:hypothetical protein RDWZM_004274 [Blomia tropicalis]